MTSLRFPGSPSIFHPPSGRQQEDEKQRSAAALSRAEDLQGELDRLAVAATLRDVSGGVSASCLINHFAGTAFRQCQSVEVGGSLLRQGSWQDSPSVVC